MNGARGGRGNRVGYPGRGRAGAALILLWAVAAQGQDRAYEPVRFALVDGRLTELFSTDPDDVGGRDFGELTAPAMGDIDGDGRLEGGEGQGRRCLPRLRFSHPRAQGFTGPGRCVHPDLGRSPVLPGSCESSNRNLGSAPHLRGDDG